MTSGEVRNKPLQALLLSALRRDIDNQRHIDCCAQTLVLKLSPTRVIGRLQSAMSFGMTSGNQLLVDYIEIPVRSG